MRFNFFGKHTKAILLLLAGGIGGYVVDRAIPDFKPVTFPIFTIILPVMAIFMGSELTRKEEENH